MNPPMANELLAEREHLALSRAALRAMRERAEQLFTVGDTVAGDAYTAEQLGRTLSERIKQLADDPTAPLFFGKLVLSEPHLDDPTEQAGTFHIGRRHITDTVGEPLVLDWRAPLSRKFYQASARDPQQVTLRRRFGWAAGKLTSFEDEHLDRGEELGTTSAILTAEIERPRVGPMRDIVATIQPEQDELVRAELGDTICVQGAPGTGKTAVGLHRAAYLLYLHRERLRRGGILIVGPNQAFLHYIAAVLPALGEIEVEQHTMESLLSEAIAGTGANSRNNTGNGADTGDDHRATAVKHDVRMAQVLRRALWSRIRPPAEPIVITDGGYRWRIDLGVLHRITTEVRAEQPPYEVGRERVRARVVGLLQRQSEARRAESPSDAWLRKVAKSKPVAAFVDHCWPSMTPEGLLFELLSDPAALAVAADGLLTEEEQQQLSWANRPRSVRQAGWSAADHVLLDEIAGLMDRMPSYGHIVVDEAQDLSPMQARALARRSSHGSLTVLGDLAQGTAPWAAADWRDTLAHLGKSDGRVVPLSTGFRVPEAVVALANRLLPALDVAVPPAKSLRRDGHLEIKPSAGTVPADTVTVAKELLAAEGSVGVIAADAMVAELTQALRDAGLDPTDVSADGRLAMVPATLVKGLEFDHVLLVEPAAIVAAEPRGMRRLYVALTRAVTSLVVLHGEPLPEPLR